MCLESSNLTCKSNFGGGPFCGCVSFLSGFPGGSVVKNQPANAGNVGWIPGSGRSPAGGNGNLQQCSCLENPMDREARCTVHGIPKSQIRLSMQMPNGPYLCRMTTVSSESGVQRQWSPSLQQSRGKRSSFFFLWFLDSRQALWTVLLWAILAEFYWTSIIDLASLSQKFQ